MNLNEEKIIKELGLLKYSQQLVRQLLGKEYQVLDVKVNNHHKRSVLLKCPNPDHPAYWTELSVIKKRCLCRKCIENPEFLSNARKAKFINACELNGCYFINVIPRGAKKIGKVLLKVCDKDGFMFNVTYDHLRWKQFSSHNKFINSPYIYENICTWINIYRPDYRLCDKNITDFYKQYNFEYTGQIDKENINPIFQTSIHNFIYGWTEHPYVQKARKSWGSELVANLLRQYNINFIYEKTFDDLLSQKNAHLFFDFFLPDYNIAIEVDGIQHQQPVDHFGGEKYFSKLQTNDEIKNQYCKKHNITLIRLPYVVFGNKRNISSEYINILDAYLR